MPSFDRMAAQHETNSSPLLGLPPWVWVGISTFVAFVLGFMVMVEGVYRFYAPPLPMLPREAASPLESPLPASHLAASPPAPSDEPVDRGPILPAPPAWIVGNDLPAVDSTIGTSVQAKERQSEVLGAADEGSASPEASSVPVSRSGALARQKREALLPPQPNREMAPPELGQAGGGRSGHTASQPSETTAPPELTAREQVAAWRRQNAWVILLVRYGYEQRTIAERTWLRLRDKVPAGLRLVQVESRDHREWLLLLGAFPTQEAAQAVAERLPPELIVRRPHLQVVAVRHLF